MLDISGDGKASKCLLTQGQLPKYCDFDQRPSRNKPFSTIVSQPFVQRVDLVLPQSLHESGWPKVSKNLSKPQYCRVFLRLSDILAGDFFNVYIKAGNIALLSEGRPGVDPIYSLNEGRLRLELPKQLYESAGLVGQPVDDGGRKHVKTRFAVEFDLRLPSAVHGRKGFDRLYWASKNVLNQSLSWLFADLQGDNHDEKSPVAAHHPSRVTIEPQVQTKSLKQPSFDLKGSTADPIFQEDAISLLEWLDLIALHSPRLNANDSIDPFLSRYAVPDVGKITKTDIVHISWKGFIPSTFVQELLMGLINAAVKAPEQWFSITGHLFRIRMTDTCTGWTTLRLASEVEQSAKAEQNAVNDEEGKQSDAGNEEAAKAQKKGVHAARFLLYEMTAG